MKTLFLISYFNLSKKRNGTLGRRTLVNKYLNLVFHIEVKTKSSYKILNLVVQFIKKKT